MTHYEFFLAALIKGFDLLLCALVFARHLQRRLPFFALFAVTILISNLGTTAVAAYYGFRTATYFYAWWIAAAATLLTRSVAIAELCSDVLRAYRGIWALAWRLLGLMAMAFLAHAAMDAKGQPHWVDAYGLTLERDLEVASVLILVAMLLIGAYYHLSLDPLQKSLVIGLCSFCAIQFVSSTALQESVLQFLSSRTTLQNQMVYMTDVWNSVYVFASCICIGMWCIALRKPLPETAKEPVLLPAGLYPVLTPEINLQLRSFNDRLLELLKP
ncbi:MAG: hypothetical protein LAO19_14375 [Acidobacteriia bacterium]|nr:hypothetical protein [Terriglobia bacterium]